jgi:hypothetical protein
VALDADGDRDAVPGVDDTGVLPRSHQDFRALRGQPPEMAARRLVRAVLAPHDGVHGKLEVVGRAAQQPLYGDGLLVGQAEAAVQVRADYAGTIAGGAPAEASKAPRSTRPSVKPSSSLVARSGWGMRPTTLPGPLQTPAMSWAEPLGLSR